MSFISKGTRLFNKDGFFHRKTVLRPLVSVPSTFRSIKHDKLWSVPLAYCHTPIFVRYVLEASGKHLNCIFYFL